MSYHGPGHATPRPLVSQGPGSRLRRIVPAIILMVLGLASSPAQAGFILEFGQTNYHVGPGQGIDVPVSLTESGSDINCPRASFRSPRGQSHKFPERGPVVRL